MSRLRISAGFTAAFVALAVLVHAGVFHGLDQYAVAHWMPWLRPSHEPFVSFWRLLVPRVQHPWEKTVLNVWVWPASVAVSGLVVLAAARRLGLRIVALWVVVNAVEVAGKLVVSRPALFTRGGVHVTGFDHSLPSGHTLRSLVVALALASISRRGRLAFVWAVTVPVSLVVTGDHVPTDVVAAALLFVAAAAALRPWAGSAAEAAASAPAAASAARAPRARGRGVRRGGP
ncbi:MAG TPA: phosphatase PAP2 family protein [Gaiellaceae bacterium]